MDTLFVVVTLALIVGLLGLIELLDRLDRSWPWILSSWLSPWPFSAICWPPCANRSGSN